LNILLRQIAFLLILLKRSRLRTEYTEQHGDGAKLASKDVKLKPRYFENYKVYQKTCKHYNLHNSAAYQHFNVIATYFAPGI
jgi:hypothetical protein